MMRAGPWLCAIALTACTSGQAASWPALGGAELQRRIVSRLSTVETTSLTAIGPRDLTADRPLREALVAAGIVELHRNRPAFTPAGRRQSIDCGDSADPGVRCFSLVRRTLVRIVRTVRTPRTIEGGGDDETFFTYRALPITPLAVRLAGAGVLICDDAARHTVSWLGSATLAAGMFVNDNIVGDARSAKLDVMDAQCPRARLQRPSSGLMTGTP